MVINILFIIVSILLINYITIKKEIKEIKKIKKQCIIDNGYITCINPSLYSYWYYPFWRYRYPYHKGSHLHRAIPYRRRWGRRFGRI